MKGFRYVAIGITIIIILISLLVPFFMGRVMKAQFTDELKQQQFPKNVSIKLLDYHAGWFYSDAKIAVTVKLMPKDAAQHLKNFPMQEISYQTDLHIINSPFVQLHLANDQSQFFIGGGVAEGQLVLSTNGNKVLEQIDGFTTPWRVYLGVGARGKMIFYMYHGKMEYTNQKTAAKLTLANIQVLAHAHAFGHWQGSVGFSHLTAQFMANIISLDGASFKFNIWENSPSMWVGNNTLTIPSMSVIVDTKPALTIKHLFASGETSVNQDKLGVVQKFGFRRLQLYGLKQGLCTLENNYKNISYPAIKDIAALAGKEKNEADIPHAALTALLFKAALNLNVTSTMKCNGDLGNYSMKASFQGPNAVPDGKLSRLHQYFDRSTGNLNFQVKLTTLADADAMKKLIANASGDPVAQKIYKSLMSLPFVLNSLSHGNGFVKKGKRFMSNFVLQNGEVDLNGKKIYPRPKPKPTADISTQGDKAGSQKSSTNASADQTTKPKMVLKFAVGESAAK